MRVCVGTALSVAVVVGIWSAPVAAQTTWHVDAAAAAGTGLSWPNAFSNLHAALLASTSGDTIRVAQGTYKPDVGHPSRPVGDRFAYWTYKAGVSIEGGYRGLGGGGSPDDRDISAFATVLSGEIGDTGIVTDNSLTLMRADVAGQILLDGLTFTKVYQDLSVGLPQGHYGSALWTFGSAGITLTGCTFRDNITINSEALQIGRGGAVFIYGTPGIISECQFINNRITGPQFQTVAAALFIWQADLQISECLFEGNVNDASGGASYAGGMYIEHGFPVISDCTFRNNTAVSGGGAVFHRNAWDPVNYPTRAGAPTFVRCRFENNSSNQGGAVWLWSRREDDVGTLRNCEFVGNNSGQNGAAVFCNPGGTTWMQVNLHGCLFTGNTSGFATFATCFDGASETSIINCTFAANGPGRAVAASGESLTVANCIFRGPTAFAQPLLWAPGGETTATTDRCDIERLATNPPANVVVTNCIDADPLFVAAASGDFRLGAGSPCVDSGNTPAVPAALATDLDGNPRASDDPAAPDTGVGPAPIVDMGAYERHPTPPPCPADFDHNGTVEPADIAGFVNAWFSSLTGGTLEGDFDGNGVVQPADVAAFVAAWFAAVSEGC